MSSATPNRLLLPGFVLNTTSTTAPSLTDPTLNTTINTTNTDMAANFTLATGKAKVFKWGGSTAKWVALN